MITGIDRNWPLGSKALAMPLRPIQAEHRFKQLYGAAWEALKNGRVLAR